MKLIYPRKRLDITWKQFFVFFFLSIFSRNEELYAVKLHKLWVGTPKSDKNVRILPVYSVRSGLDLFLRAQKYPAGSVAIVTAVSIADMATVIESHNIKVESVDINPVTLEPDTTQLELLIKKHRKKVVFVMHAHLFGGVARLNETLKIAKKNNILFIEDCAQTFDGFNYQGHSETDLSLWSFGPIKTATAFAGGIVQVHESCVEILRKMREVQRGDPKLSRIAYMRRLTKFAKLHLFSTPLLFSLIVKYFSIVNKSYDTYIAGQSRSFSASELLPQLRYRPSVGLLAVMYYRQSHFNKMSINARIDSGIGVRFSIPPKSRIGAHAMIHTFWLNAVHTEKPAWLVEQLRAHGIDASAISTSLSVIKKPSRTSSNGLSSLLPGIIYVPCYPGMPDSERRRVINVTSKLLGNIPERGHSAQISYGALQTSYHVNRHAPKNSLELARVVKAARDSSVQLTLVAQNNSHGGHTTQSGTEVVDLSNLSRIVDYDNKTGNVTVEAGIDTLELQKFLIGKGRSMTSLQSSVGFSVGGCIASNIHGRSMKYTSFSESLVSMKVMDSKGSISTIMPSDKEWPFVIGGLGLRGIIVEATLTTQLNTQFKKSTEIIPTKDLQKCITKILKTKSEVYLWIRLTPDLRWNYDKAYINYWVDTEKQSAYKYRVPKPSKLMLLLQRFFMMSMYHLSPAMSITSYSLEHKIATGKNKAEYFGRAQLSMPPVVDGRFLHQDSSRWVNHTQEYFIPIKNITKFLAYLSKTQREESVKLLTVTLRYIKKSDISVLSQTPNYDALGVMMYMHTHRDSESIQATKHFIQLMTQQAINLDGKPYLTYCWAQTPKQLAAVYPKLKTQVAQNKEVGLINNEFAERMSNELL